MFQSAYGLTECTTTVFQAVPTETNAKSPIIVDYVQEHIEVKVINENGDLVPFGTPGELCVRCYSNMLKYWDDEEKTNEILGKDGWLRTGFVLSLPDFFYNLNVLLETSAFLEKMEVEN